MASSVIGQSGDIYTSASSIRRSKAHVSTEPRLLYMLAFMCFLVLVTLMRLLPRSVRPASFTRSKPLSIIGEARAMTNELIPFVFMH